MIITNCPRCGSMNATTTCANCGWSQFTTSTVSTRITGEIELKVSGKALLDDYKRLLLENRNLKERVAELERDFDMLFRSSANKQPRKNTQTLTLPPEVQE
jgi:regulator of replication initiation timing